MSHRYHKQLRRFLEDVKGIEDAKNAIYEMSDEIDNAVIVSGQMVGEDTNKIIIEIGKRHGLLVFSFGLTVSYRTP